MAQGYQHHHQLPKPGNVAFSWYGSHPTHIVDTQTFEPNFRLFDFWLQANPPSRYLMETIWTQPEGERHSTVHNVFGGTFRCVPMVVTCLTHAMVCHYSFCKYFMKPTSNMKWGLLPFTVMAAMWHNGTRFLLREKSFSNDFRRNQGYAMEELKAQRDAQRVREALWSFDYINDPYGEYRVKQWQVARRFT
jgi:hypothetical protein